MTDQNGNTRISVNGFTYMCADMAEIKNRGGCIVSKTKAYLDDQRPLDVTWLYEVEEVEDGEIATVRFYEDGGEDETLKEAVAKEEIGRGVVVKNNHYKIVSKVFCDGDGAHMFFVILGSEILDEVRSLSDALLLAKEYIELDLNGDENAFSGDNEHTPYEIWAYYGENEEKKPVEFIGAELL